jgi:glyoxylase-like metal-dependent hydrolase (beta-lactamase superfamily II)
MTDTLGIRTFFHKPTCTATYVVAAGGHAAIIDSALDYDQASGRSTTKAADEIIAYVLQENFTVDWILETHVHADHLTAAPYLREKLGGRIGISESVCAVQETFRQVFNFQDDFVADGSQFDHLFRDNETFELGGLSGTALHTPGHTPACVCYHIGGAVFVGDTLFMPDFGTARCDFPGGDAGTLYRSVRRILDLPPETRVFVGHDYAPGDRGYEWESTVAQERAENKHVKDGIDEAAFVAMRSSRDAELSMPGLILPSVQVNIRGGALPLAEENGVSYLKIPVNAL